MKVLRQSVRWSLLGIAAGGLSLTAQQALAQGAAPGFGQPNPNGAFGRPNPNGAFGRPAAPATGAATPAASLPAPVTSTAAPPDVATTYLWDSGGQLAISQLGIWGNGTGQVVRTITYNGDDVLQMTTRNFNEGAAFELATPVNIADYQENGYLRLRLRFKDLPTAGAPGGIASFGSPGSGSSSSGSSGSSSGSSSSSPSFGSSSGFGRPSGFSSSSSSPGFGAPGFGASSPEGSPEGFPGTSLLPLGPLPQSTPIRRLLVTFVQEKGISSGTIDLPADLSKIQSDDDGWRLFLLPVKDMRQTPGASGPASRMIITSDKEDTFYMAQSALVVETEQMSVRIRKPTDPIGAQIAELTLKPGLVTLVADVEAGTADPIIEWNFDADNKNPYMARPAFQQPDGIGVPGAPGVTPEGAPGGGFGAPGGGFVGAPAAGGGFGSSPGIFGAPGGAFGGENGAAVAPVFGPPVDARGLVAKFEYPNEEQDYRVEVTVSDRAGKKAPVKASVLIHIRS